MKITFELEPADIARLQHALARARDAVRSADECEIIDSAKHTLDGLLLGDAPAYVRDRVKQVQRLLSMLDDDAWALPSPHREGIITALVYFSDPDDLIPDAVPVIGMLDDAIVLEMLLRQEQELLRAYDEFCAFRRRLGPRPADLDGRTHWAAELQRCRGRLLQRTRDARAAV